MAGALRTASSSRSHNRERLPKFARHGSEERCDCVYTRPTSIDGLPSRGGRNFARGIWNQDANDIRRCHEHGSAPRSPRLAPVQPLSSGRLQYSGGPSSHLLRLSMARQQRRAQFWKGFIAGYALRSGRNRLILGLVRSFPHLDGWSG